MVKTLSPDWGMAIALKSKGVYYFIIYYLLLFVFGI